MTINIITKFILILLLLINFSYTYATDISIIKSYNNFIIKLESKYEMENQLIILEKIKKKIEETLKSKKISNKSIILLKELNTINNRKILDIKKQINNNNLDDSYQKEIEKNETSKFKAYKIPNIPDYVLNIIDSKNRIYLNVIYDENSTNFEYFYNWKINRLIFNTYYKINSLNSNSLKTKNWYIFYFNWDYILVDNYEIEEKIPYSESYKYFKGVIKNDTNYFLKNWTYYYYKFDKYSYINEKYWFYKKNLEWLWFEINNIVLYNNWNNYTFVNNFTEEKLINYDLIQYINNKNKFLTYLYDDKKNISYDTDKYFIELKKTSEKLTQWLTKDEKIKVIYNYILDNINYTNPIDLSKKEIFSWIHTYKNKDWVCEWYVKLMAYMLMFSWIEDIEVIRWFVINAPDFPKVWHAWLKIWNYYYDPTFDDPIWNVTTKTFNEYVYYKLPWDLFYTNRYDILNLPEELKTKNKAELSLMVNKNLYNLVTKYKNNWYNILKYSIMLNENWLNYNDTINIDILEKILKRYDVNWKDMSFIENWKKIYIKKFKYFKIDDTNIEEVLRSINYDFSNKYILKWDFWNGNEEYRLAYELETF